MTDETMLGIRTLEATALAQLSSGPEAMAEGQKVLAAIRTLRDFSEAIANNAACLRCSATFPTAEELGRHYGTHRS